MARIRVSRESLCHAGRFVTRCGGQIMKSAAARRGVVSAMAQQIPLDASNIADQPHADDHTREVAPDVAYKRLGIVNVENQARI